MTVTHSTAPVILSTDAIQFNIADIIQCSYRIAFNSYEARQLLFILLNITRYKYTAEYYYISRTEYGLFSLGFKRLTDIPGDSASHNTV